jgi:hypothetical protein
VNTLPADGFDDALRLDAETFDTLTVTVDSIKMEVRRHEAVYVARPIAMAPVQPSRGVPPNGMPDSGVGTPLKDPYAYQRMIIYMPRDKPEHRAVILHVGNSGWFASSAAELIEPDGIYGRDDPVGAALSAGYIIASAGTRSRGALAVDGRYPGKSPAAVVDAKAAIRYLRLNSKMLGASDQIVITGTSGGGALSAVVAASGNSADYYPYLAEIGAAGINSAGRSTLRDDVFATIAYCPITDLGHADIAYEWQFAGVRTAANTIQGDHSMQAESASKTLAGDYPAYLASLGLSLDDGRPLNVETMREAIVAAVRSETEAVLATGMKVPAIGEEFLLVDRGQTKAFANDWLRYAGKVIDVDYEKFLDFVADATPLKVVPAFDSTANTGRHGLRGENSLFGDDSIPYSNFTPYGWNNNEVAGDASGPDDTSRSWEDELDFEGSVLAEQLRLIDPFYYLATNSDVAPNWYLRHGMIDRDTSFAVELALAFAAKRRAEDVNFRLAWLRPHSGNYDVPEAHEWLAARLSAADRL